MKRFFVVIFILVLASIACQTVMSKTPLVSETTTATEADSTNTQPPNLNPITCFDDSCLDACLTRINSVLETRQFEALGGAYANLELNLVVYKIENGQLSEPNILYVPEEFKPFQEDIQAHQLVWNYASALLPSEHLKWINEYLIFTDGAESGGWAAWVDTRDPLDRSRWQLGVDIADAEDPIDLTYTLIHEFAHLISLNPDQIPQDNGDYDYGWDQDPARCIQFSLPEGCSNSNSYINRFYQKFWLDIFDEWRRTVEQPQINSDDEFDALVNDFHSKHQDQFVSEYAATDIYEDLAESFELFALEPKPSGKGIADQKILFFYDFPELVAMRQQIIQNVCSYTQE